MEAVHPRKALANVRAGLRFAQEASDECGHAHRTDEDPVLTGKDRPARAEDRSTSTTKSAVWDVVGRNSFARHGNWRHKFDTGESWTTHASMHSNSPIAAAHPGKPPHSRRSERSNGHQGPLEPRMSTECRPSAASSTAPIEMSSPRAKRRIDRIDEPARPLGAKRAALQMRRQRTAGPSARPAPKDGANPQHERTLVSKDSFVTFTLRATDLGLLIERAQGQHFGARLVQTMVFADSGSFERWCASEPMRFEDPGLYDQLRREGHDALGGKR
jgi:hypothetical protein